MKSANISMLIIAGFVLLSVLACNGIFTPELPTPTPPAVRETLVAAPVPTFAPMSEGFVISTLHLNETGPNAEYTVNAQYPAILDTNDPHALEFNDQMYALVQDEIAAFKQSVVEAPKDPTFAASSLDVKYALTFPAGSFTSIRFDFSGYISGAAHPYLYSVSINYHFDLGRVLTLDDIFRSDSNYLETISSYCIAELSQRDIGFEASSAGAVPTAENYRNWNIIPGGMMITFNAYQVAPGAAGSQTVIVPISELLELLDPTGPLS